MLRHYFINSLNILDNLSFTGYSQFNAPSTRTRAEVPSLSGSNEVNCAFTAFTASTTLSFLLECELRTNNDRPLLNRSPSAILLINAGLGVRVKFDCIVNSQ